MKIGIGIVLIPTIMMLISGCAGNAPALPKVTLTPNSLTKQVDLDINATIRPILINSYNFDQCENAFILTIDNNSKKDIEIVWNKTYYLSDNQTNGNFMTDGTVIKYRNNPKPNDIVFTGTKTVKSILPSNLVDFIGGSWINECFSGSKVGVYLTLKEDGKEIKNKFEFNFEVMKRPIIGIHVQSFHSMSDEIQNQRHILGGAYVVDVDANSPASRAGIKKGDIIVQVHNGFSVSTISSQLELDQALDAVEIGGVIKIAVFHPNDGFMPSTENLEIR